LAQTLQGAVGVLLQRSKLLLGRVCTLGAVSAAAMSLICQPAAAVEGGMSAYPKGFEGFMSGYVPPQAGVYVSNIYYFFHGSVGSEVRNGHVELGIDVTLNADFLEGEYVTNAKVLGGQFAFGGAIGWAWANLDATVTSPLANRDVSLHASGFADMLLMPASLGWHDGNFHWNLTAMVYVPSGHYSTDELSVGKNVWGFMPQFAMTYFDPQTGWESSGAFIYSTLSRNAATDYQSGDVLHLDWAIGKHFGTGLA
jgi:hypothetical protein